MRMVIVIILSVLVAPRASHALNFFELEVYPATTEGQGLHEVESRTSVVASGRDREGHEGLPGEEEGGRHHLVRSSFEYNYGLTDHIDVAMYIDLRKPNGADVEFGGFRARARGALWDRGRYPVDLGWYFEAELPTKEESTLELEFRPIISRDFGRLTVDVDPIFELPTISEERRTVEFGYASRFTYHLSRMFEPALEFYGGLGQIRDLDPSQEAEHYVFPMAGLHVGAWKVQIGPGFGLTRGSDSVLVKMNLEYEFTLP